MNDQIPIQPNGVQPQIQYVQAPQQHHWFTLILVGLASAGLAYYAMKSDQDKYRLALEETVTARLQKIGTSTQLQGNVVDYAELAKQSKLAMGNEFAAFVAKTNGTFQSVSTAMGEVKASIAELKKPTGERLADGSFNASLEQNREKLPSLSAVNLKYDPSKPGLTGLTGKWNNYNETFTASYADWRTEHDGMRSAINLKREVYRDQEKTQKVGSETIEVVNGDAHFSTAAVAKIAPFPKYTFTLSTSFDMKNNYKGYDFSATKWLTRGLGINTGYSRQGPYHQTKLGVSWNYGLQ